MHFREINLFLLFGYGIILLGIILCISHSPGSPTLLSALSQLLTVAPRNPSGVSRQRTRTDPFMHTILGVNLPFLRNSCQTTVLNLSEPVQLLISVAIRYPNTFKNLDLYIYHIYSQRVCFTC